MEPSKATVNYFRKKLRQQKRRKVLMFFIGLLIGGGIAFNIYYWYPLLQKEFNFPEISQFRKNIVEAETTITSSTTEETTETSTQVSEEEPFKPRTDVSKVNPKYASLNQELEQTISGYNPSGTILVVKDNQVVLNNNYGKALESSNDPINSTYMIASVQKFITSILVMNLIDEDKLSLDTPLSNFYSNIPNSENITIDQMLSMTSGLFLENKLKNSQSKEESINYVVNNVTYQPTDKWRYSDVNFFLLGAIIEKISQTTYEDYFDQVIKVPLGLKNTGFYQANNINPNLIPSYGLNESGEVNQKPNTFSESAVINELGTGNMYITTGDLLVMAQAMFDGKIVSRDVVEMTYAKKEYTYPYNYKAGLYDENGHYYGHGIFRGYEPSIAFNKDASSAVIFLGNIYYKDGSNSGLAKKLFEQTSQYRVGN
ncbi:serine hydrolase domain-containing protein [Vagococcus fluvialis]|uniref:serine hydrolase domain-containing protein n=1 Tax=Vagococcus fluvialis TaxID=2738 RepID=UPI003B5B7EC8